MRTTTVAALLLTLTAGSSIAAAQPPRREMNARGVERARVPQTNAQGRNAEAPRGRDMRSPAVALLRQRDRLALTDEQTKQLEALAAAHRNTVAASPSHQLRLRADLLDATGRNADPAAARAALDKLSDVRNARIVAAMEAREQVRAVLTPAQLSTIDAARGPRGGHRAGKAGARGRRGDLQGAGRGAGQGRPPQGPRGPRG